MVTGKGNYSAESRGDLGGFGVRPGADCLCASVGLWQEVGMFAGAGIPMMDWRKRTAHLFVPVAGDGCLHVSLDLFDCLRGMIAFSVSTTSVENIVSFKKIRVKHFKF